MPEIQFFDPTASLNTTIMRLSDRNRKAQDIIQSYAKTHAGMDIAIGLVGLIPGAAIPALVAALAAQAPLIYQPMSRDLAAVYLADEAELGSDVQGLKKIVAQETVHTGALDIANEFGTEFMMQIGHELALEAGLGVLGSLCVPIIGGAVGAALDYLIANMMTWRVGTMVSLYYQNGGKWLGTQHQTFETAKTFTGGMLKNVRAVVDFQKSHSKVRVDLNNAGQSVAEVRHAQVATVKSLVEMMKGAMSNQQIREALMSKGIPLELIETALLVYATRSAGSGARF